MKSVKMRNTACVTISLTPSTSAESTTRAALFHHSKQIVHVTSLGLRSVLVEDTKQTLRHGPPLLPQAPSKRIKSFTRLGTRAIATRDKVLTLHSEPRHRILALRGKCVVRSKQTRFNRWRSKRRSRALLLARSPALS